MSSEHNIYRYHKEFKNGKSMLIEIKDLTKTSKLSYSDMIQALEELTNRIKKHHSSIAFDLFHDGVRNKD